VLAPSATAASVSGAASVTAASAGVGAGLELELHPRKAPGRTNQKTRLARAHREQAVRDR